MLTNCVNVKTVGLDFAPAKQLRTFGAILSASGVPDLALAEIATDGVGAYGVRTAHTVLGRTLVLIYVRSDTCLTITIRILLK